MLLPQAEIPVEGLRKRLLRLSAEEFLHLLQMVITGLHTGQKQLILILLIMKQPPF